MGLEKKDFFWKNNNIAMTLIGVAKKATFVAIKAT